MKKIIIIAVIMIIVITIMVKMKSGKTNLPVAGPVVIKKPKPKFSINTKAVKLTAAKRG